MASSSLFAARPKRLSTLLPFGQQDVTNGLVGWYNGDGNSARDLSGNNNTGILGSSVAFAPSPYGNAYNFNGTSTSGVALPAALQLSTFTWTAWIYLNSFSTFEFFIGATGINGAVLYGGNSTLYFAKYGVAYIGTLASALSLGRWMHVAVSCVAGVSFAMYVNGLLSAAGATGYTFTNSTIYLGGSAGPNRAVNGRVADARFFNRVLTPGEVYAIYASALTPEIDGDIYLPGRLSAAFTASLAALQPPASILIAGKEGFKASSSAIQKTATFAAGALEKFFVALAAHQSGASFLAGGHTGSGAYGSMAAVQHAAAVAVSGLQRFSAVAHPAQHVSVAAIVALERFISASSAHQIGAAGASSAKEIFRALVAAHEASAKTSGSGVISAFVAPPVAAPALVDIADAAACVLTITDFAVWIASIKDSA